MVTEVKMRGLGIPRTDVERLMEHRGISAGEAEELLRVNPAEALLPQRGTGLLLGTAAEVHSPFPTSLRVEGTNHHQVDVALGGIIRAIKLWKNVGADGTRDVMAAYGTGTTFDTLGLKSAVVGVGKWDLDTGAITLDDYDITVDAINVITPPTTEPRGEQVTVAFAAL